MAEQLPINQAQAIAVRDDEINLVELFTKIWQRKWWVLACTLLATISALVYVLLAKPVPVYKAETFLMPPTAADLEEINQPVFLREQTLRSNEAGGAIKPTSAYVLFLGQLESKTASKRFLNSASAALSVRDNKPFVRVTLQGGDPSIGIILNDYVKSVQRHTAELLANERRAQLKNMIRDTELMIAVKSELQAENLKAPSALIELNERLKYLEKVIVSAENIIPVTVDQAASTPRQANISKKALILIAGVVMGCVLGLFLALAVPMRKKTM